MMRWIARNPWMWERRFAWWPIEIGGVMVWLETYYMRAVNPNEGVPERMYRFKEEGRQVDPI